MAIPKAVRRTRTAFAPLSSLAAAAGCVCTFPYVAVGEGDSTSRTSREKRAGQGLMLHGSRDIAIGRPVQKEDTDLRAPTSRRCRLP